MKHLAICRGLALALTLAAAAHADVAWQDRGDRWEGIRPENTGAGDFELVGVHLEPEVRGRGAAKLLVDVPGLRPPGLKIHVWEPARGYAMIPKPGSLRAGEPFVWSRSAVLGLEGIEADALFVLATSGDSPTLYHPARLTTTSPAAGVAAYVFRFRSRGGVDLDLTIAREDKDGRLVTVRGFQRQEQYGSPSLDFRWDGLDSAGKPVPPGIYHFKLEGTVFLKNDLKPQLDLRFVHYGNP